jgi:hypothetical protein
MISIHNKKPFLTKNKLLEKFKVPVYYLIFFFFIQTFLLLHKLPDIMKNYFSKNLLLSALFLTALSCGQNKQEKPVDEFADTTTSVPDSAKKRAQEILDFKFFYTIANLPSPMEMINAIYENKVPFNKDLLNSADKASQYSSAFKKAVNYGIYGIDMAYAAFYGQNQDLLDYYSSSKKMAEKLSVQETFDRFTSSFMDNEQNRDSLLKIIDKAYAETDSYLRSNRRVEVASHVLAGSIMEAMYLSVELMKNAERTNENANMYEKIYNEKLYLDNLINLFSDLTKYPTSAAFLAQLKSIKTVYDGIKSPEELNKENMARLSAAISPVRNDLVK